MTVRNEEAPASVALVPAASQPGPGADRERYAVLLLDEDQLERFLTRPRMRGVASDSLRMLPAWRRAPQVTIRRAAITAAAVAAAATFWIRGSGNDLEAPIAAAAPVVKAAPSLPTGASFSVRLGRFAGESETRATAGRLVKAGLPAFAWRVDGRLPDLLVGPFVSIDEAERAQRALAGKGFARSRLHVDDSLRTTGKAAASATPAVLAVAAPGREALVFELSGEPRAVSGERVDATTFDVLTSPTGGPVEAQEWKAPGDVHLIHRVVVEADPTGERGLTARVTVARDALARVRVERSRVYVDVEEAVAPPSVASAPRPARPAAVAGPAAPLAPAAPDPVVPAAPPVAGPGTSAAAAAASPASEDVVRYREAIAPVFARFEEIQPFLRAAVGQENPDVLAALAGTLAELEQTLRGVSAPREAAAVHNLLISAAQLARGAASLPSAAERAGQVREAMAQFQAARGRLK